MRSYQPVSFLGVELPGTRVGIVGLVTSCGPLVVVVVVGGFPGLPGFQLPVVIVVISGAEVVVVAYCASVLPPDAPVTGDVVVVLVVASPEEQIVTYTLCDTEPLLVLKTHC